MAAFADTAFGKDTAFASTAFDFGVSGGGGPPGGTSGRSPFGEIHHGGHGHDLLARLRHKTEAEQAAILAAAAAEEARRQDEAELEAILYAISHLL